MAKDKEFVKIYRKLLMNPVICKDNDHLALWIHLLLTVQWIECDSVFNNQRITLKPGQGIYGRKMLADKLHISESKCERILTLFKSEQQIEQQTSSRNRLITILNWSSYQKRDQLNGQQVNNERTTSGQQVDTYKEYKEYKELKNYKNKDLSYDADAREGNEAKYAGLSIEEAFVQISLKPFSEPLTEEEVRIIRSHDGLRREGFKRIG